MPMEYTEAMVCQCSECRYEFVKHPEDVDRPELDVTPNDSLRELIEEWREKAEHNGEPASRFYEHFAGELERVLEELGGHQ